MNFVLLINLKLLTIANSFLLNIAEHENFSANKYENANNSYEHEKFSANKYEKAFLYLLAEKISCSADLSIKKFYNLGACIVDYSCCKGTLQLTVLDTLDGFPSNLYRRHLL